MSIRILDVGQCGFDGPRMATLWHRELGATVDRVATATEAKEAAKKESYDVILVNRVLAFDQSSGLDVIKQFVADQSTVPIMLVSDKNDAQDEAVKLGAVRGFGKSDLGNPDTIDLIKKITSK